MTELTKAITRRIGNMILRITPDAEDPAQTRIELRGYRRRRRIEVTCARIASLVEDAGPITLACEDRCGRQVLAAIGAAGELPEKRD